MFLERLELTDFRNYESLDLEFSAPLCILFGSNAQGKTNILEAVLMLALARSPRCARDGEMVRWGADEAAVRGEFRRRQRDPVSLGLSLRPDGSKRIKVDGIARRRVIDAVGEVNAVLFGPDELRLVSGSPSERRGFLNTCLGQTSPRYLDALAGYRAGLRQRNGLLRRAAGRRLDEDLLTTYDEQLAGHAAVLMAARIARIAQLTGEADQVHRRLAGGRESLAAEYEPSVPLPAAGDEAALAAAVVGRLRERREAELARGVTLCGPHRDDLRVTIDGRDARTFASQGQQRTAALALKIAELRVVRQAIGEPPLLLLDDVMSELDDLRRAEVLSLTDEAEQVFITCSQQSTFSEAILRRAAVYRVTAGRVEPVVEEPA
ncbi:MAG: DNA replication/repair protein RecF [Armatimonadetes bacterium]|nr:DNA replication/repair protein RecF [Armatimonadota bacterium]